MQCANCNSELEPGAKVCGNCGAPVPEAAEESTLEPTVMVSRNEVDMAAPEEAEPGGGTPEQEAPIAEAGEAIFEASQEEKPVAQPEAIFEEPVVEAAPPAPRPESKPYTSQPASSFPVDSSAPPAPREKVMGMEAGTAGIVALILSIIGLLLSCGACGGIFSVVGIIMGGMTLRTSGRTAGLIGLILGIVGLLIALVMACIFSSIIITSSSYTY